MRYDDRGLTLWFGTRDVPAPSDDVPAGTEVPVSVGVQRRDGAKEDIGKHLKLLYRVNGGTTKVADVQWLWNASARNYYRAILPPFCAGEVVEYTFSHLTDGEPPPFDEMRQFAASFHVLEPGPEYTASPGDGAVKSNDERSLLGGGAASREARMRAVPRPPPPTAGSAAPPADVVGPVHLNPDPDDRGVPDHLKPRGNTSAAVNQAPNESSRNEPTATPASQGYAAVAGSIQGMGAADIAANKDIPVRSLAASQADTTAEVRSREAAIGTAASGDRAAAANHETRINTLNTVLTKKDDQEAVRNEFLTADGNWSAALAGLTSRLPEASLKKVALAHSLAVWSDDNVPVVKAVLAAQPDLTNLRDVALRFNVDKLTTLVDSQVVPETTPGATADEKQKNFAVALRQKLFVAEPTAVLHRMVADAEIPIADVTLRNGVTRFFDNLPDFNIRTTSVYTALKHPEAFKNIPDEHRAGVVEHLKTLQRVQALSPVPEALPVLMKANLTSAFHVGEMPESTFLSAHGQALGEETARQVYTHAINTRIRNEHALMTMRESVKGTGLAIIDGQQPLAARMARMQAVADQQAVPLNLETLFGSIDYCECDDCLSVYSPASYFVELLQYLRNNNLDPEKPNTKLTGIDGTPLEKLFRRRPDLGCLELTCQNTFTVLPYIDLVNEVMESFVVHRNEYHNDTHDPKQATLEVFNVLDETSSELLAQPQHINYEAYCILKSAVYPFTLPFHQPISAIRVFLNYLGTSRYELLDTYRTAHEMCPDPLLMPADQQELEDLHKTTLDRAVDAEFLGLTQEEYIILTREAFWPKRYFEITQKTSYTDEVYHQKIGVRPVPEYYGYTGKDPQPKDDMLSTDEILKRGLTFVKKQFLPRTGIQYVDLVELLKTRFINPSFPQGEALAILESIRFSYRFLQTLVDTGSTNPLVRFAKLIEFLETYQPLVSQLEPGCIPTLATRNHAIGARRSRIFGAGSAVTSRPSGS